MPAPAPPLVTLTLFGFPLRSQPWAFMQMGLARAGLARTGGLRFWKLVGAGHGRGFSLRPDFGRYGLLAVWEEPRAADVFFRRSPVYESFAGHADERWTIRLRPLAAHGRWAGTNPFLPVGKRDDRDGGKVVVLTRATLAWRRWAAFWRSVPDTSAALERADGLVASIGIGEVPYLRQATFSLWRSEADMRRWAYGDALHREVIRRTRGEGWYSEELFARFAPLSSTGTWDGRDPLAE